MSYLYDRMEAAGNLIFMFVLVAKDTYGDNFQRIVSNKARLICLQQLLEPIKNVSRDKESAHFDKLFKGKQWQFFKVLDKEPYFKYVGILLPLS